MYHPAHEQDEGAAGVLGTGEERAGKEVEHGGALGATVADDRATIAFMGRLAGRQGMTTLTRQAVRVQNLEQVLIAIGFIQ